MPTPLAFATATAVAAAAITAFPHCSPHLSPHRFSHLRPHRRPPHPLLIPQSPSRPSAPQRRSAPLPTPRASLVAPSVAVILLAGGSGKRMQADRPKQYLPLAGRPVIEHSLALFGAMPEVSQLVVVADASWHAELARAAAAAARHGCRLDFALPGRERQHSVYNGLQRVDAARLVCIHDAARPLVSAREVRDVLRDADEFGAAVLGVPAKATIKESADGQFVLRTIPRERLWEIQTPQVVRAEVLRRGFDKVRAEGLEVTDDVSIVEQLGEPVKITRGEYTNIKLTTPEDMNIAESILSDRVQTEVA